MALGFVAGLLVAGCVASEDLITTRVLSEARARRDPGPLPTATATATALPATSTLTPTRTLPPGRTYARVLRVWDGNTILVAGGYSVRYIGVATPGAGMFRRPLEPFGREAAERNVELVEGKEVELEADESDVDAAGNMLRYVYVDGAMVNEVLLSEGLARRAPLGPNSRHASRLQAAEMEARQMPVAIWTLATLTPLPTSTPTITPPPTNTSPPSPPPPASPTATLTPAPRVFAPQPGTPTRAPTLTLIPTRSTLIPTRALQ